MLIRIVALLAVASAARGDVVDDVIALHEAGKSLKQIAGRDATDPWVVADDLCARGAFDAAAAFADAGLRKDTEALPDYVASRRTAVPDKDARKALTRAEGAEPAAALAALASVSPAARDALAVRVHFARAAALRGLLRLDESERSYAAAATLAEELGWLALASEAGYLAGKCAAGRGRHADARRHWERRLAIARKRDHTLEIAATLGALGTLEEAVGNYDRALELQQQCLDLARPLGDADTIARAVSNIGVVHTKRREYAKALGLHERALEQAKDAKLRGAIVLNLGTALAGLDKRDEALQRFREAARIFEDAGDTRYACRIHANIGNILTTMRRLDEALAAHKQSLQLAEAIGDQEAVSASLGGVGAIHAHRRDFEKALDYRRRALEIDARSGAAPRIARSLWHVGSLLMRFGDNVAALDHLQKAERAYAALKDIAGVVRVATAIARVHGVTGARAQAERAASRAVRLAERSGDKALAAKALRTLGGILALHDEPERARKFLEAALRISESSGDVGSAAEVLTTMGEVESALGNYAAATEHLNRALELCGDNPAFAPIAAHATGNLGVVLFYTGRFTRALALQTKALERAIQLEERHLASRALDNLGTIHWALGEYDRALGFHQRGLVASEALGDRTAMATALGNIGNVYASRGRYTRALEHYRRGLRLAEKAGARTAAARALGNIGAMYLQLGQPRRALAAQERALASTGDRNRYLALIGIAWSNSELGDYAKALDYLRQALALARKQGAVGGAARALEGIGHVQEAQGDHEAALATYKRALAVHTKGEDPSAQAVAHAHVARVLVHSKRYDEAIRHYRQALSRWREIGHRHAGTTALNLANVYLRFLHRPAEAVPLLKEAIADVELGRAELRGLAGAQREAFAHRMRRGRPYASMALAQLQLGRPAEALAYVERGRARHVLDLLARSRFDPLVETERRAREQGDPRRLAAIKDVREGLRAADRDVRRLAQQLAREQSRKRRRALRAELKEARTSRAELLERRALLVKALVPMGAPIGIETLQRALGRTDCLLYYSLGETARVFVVPPAGNPCTALELRYGSERLAATIRAFLAAIGRDGNKRGADAAGKQLFDALVPTALRKRLAKVERVYVVPDGVLHGLPFEALPGWLEAMPPVAYAHSASVLLWCMERRAAQEHGKRPFAVVAAGDPVFAREGVPSRLAPLPATRIEVEAIVKALGAKRVRSLLGEDATKAALFRAAPRGRYLHLATHQQVDLTPWRSGSRLALTVPRAASPDDDGFLTLRELFENWRDRLAACELVVLSACRTLKGPLQENEGPYAMPLGFLYAGAPAVIGSLWHVDDASTAELFADFYRRLGRGASKLEAFTAARRALKKKYPAPYHWAAFVYIGDPR